MKLKWFGSAPKSQSVPDDYRQARGRRERSERRRSVALAITATLSLAVSGMTTAVATAAVPVDDQDDVLSSTTNNDSVVDLLRDAVEGDGQQGQSGGNDESQSGEGDDSQQSGNAPQPMRTQVPSVTPFAVGNTLSCEAVYGVSASGQIQEVAIPGGAKSNVGNTPVKNGNNAVTSFNGLGISPGGLKAYGYERTNSTETVALYTFNPELGSSGQWAAAGVTYDSRLWGRPTTQFIGGAVAPDGTYYLGGYNGARFNIFSYDESGGNVVFRGFIDVGSSTANNGDMAFDAQGTLYIVRGAGSTVTIYPVSASTLASATGSDTDALRRGESRSFPAMYSVNGAAFGQDGRAFLGSSSTVRGYNMPDWSNSSDLATNLSSTDLASCSNPPTVLLQKNVIARDSASDQFELELKQGVTEIGSAVTTGTDTGIQAESVGPFPVSAGVDLQFSEKLSQSGNITDDYFSSYECVVNQGTPQEEELSSGDGTSGSVAVPATGSDPIVCTFTNTPKQGTWELSKSSDPASGSKVKPGDTITYTVTAKNTSAVDVTDVVVNDDLTEVLKYADLVEGSIAAQQGTASVTGNTLTWNVGTLTANTTKTVQYTVEVKDSAVGVTLKNVATGTGGVPPEKCAAGSDECSTTHETGKPEIIKTGESATKQPGPALVYDLLYKIEVSNPTEAVLDYTLTDAPPALPAGVTLKSDWTAEASGTAGTIVQATKGTNDPWTIAIGNLGVGAKHTYLIKAVVEVDRTVAVGDEACEDTGKTGLVLINGATIKTGDFEASDEGCVAIEMTQLDMTKAVTSTTANADGTWTVVYDIVVSMPNQGTVDEPHYGRTTYDLSDELRFGDGISVNSAEWKITGNNPNQITTQNPASGTFAGVTATLADDRPIGGSQSADEKNTYEHTYTVTVNASVAESAWGTDALKCQAPGSLTAGGFLNVATLDYSGGQIIDDACSTPAVPTIEKNGQQAQLSDGAWTLTYDLVVSNTSDSELPFKLTDAPSDMPTGVERQENWTASPLDGAPLDEGAASFDGTGTWTLVANGTIPAKTTYKYTVSTTVKLTTAVDESVIGECEDTDNSGILFPNVATIESGKHTDSDTGCVAIPVGGLDLDKTWTASTQKEDGTWDVTYEVTVTNDSEVNQVYDLTDSIEFDQTQIKVLGGAWTGPNDTNGSIASGATSLELAKGQTLTAGGTHTYTVTINASVEPSAWTAPENPTRCEAQGGPENGGFFNTAHLKWVGGADDAEDCASPERPRIDKQFLFANQDADDPNLWSVGYTVFVLGTQNSSFYVDVYDQPDYPSGVELVKGSWFTPYPDEGGIPITRGEIATDGADAWVVQRGVEVPKGGMVRYQVTWDVRIPGSIPSEDAECDAEGAPGKGFFNEARLVNGDTTQKDDACGPIVDVVNPVVEKDVVSSAQNADGTWSIEYDVTVLLPTKGANPNHLSAKYDLVDTLDYGDGLEPVSASWKQVTPASDPASSGDFNKANWTATLAKDKVITVSQPQHVYRVSVIANAANSAFENGTAECVVGEDGREKSGFLNRVVMSSNSVNEEADACSEPASPEVEKTALPVVDNGDGTWTVAYTVAVTNPTKGDAGQALAYVLTDTPADLPAGVEPVGGWSAEADGSVTSSAGLPTNANRPDTGDWVVAEGTIPADTTYSFTISAKVKLNVADLADETIGSCEGSDVVGVPLTNSVGVVSGEFEADDEDCSTIPVPELDIAKTWKSSEQTTTDGQWTVVYDVVVTNDGEEGTVYDLVDDIKFDGTNVKVVSAAWSGASTGTFADGETSATLATNKYLAGGESDTYTVTVIAEVVPGAWKNPGSLECAAPGQSGNGGFLNSATLTFPGGEDSDEDCATPVRPTVAKDGVSATQSDVDPSQWSVAYTITVAGKALTADTLYDLADGPAFADGVVIDKGVASLRGGATEYQNITIPAAGGTIAEDVSLPKGTDHVWDVVWTVSINEPIEDGSAECAAEGEPGKGFFNTAELSTGGTEQEDDACLPIDELVRPAVEKTADSVVQNADGTWTVVYGVTVTLPEGEDNPNDLSAKYDLVDTLDYGDGLEPVSASWKQVVPASTAAPAGDFDDSDWTAILASDKVITPSAPVHRYEVTVVANAANGAFENGTAECKAPGSSDKGSGFLNQAVMSSGGSDSTVEACAEPAAPKATKVAHGAPVQNADGTWTIQYLAEVTNPTSDESPSGAIDLAYEVTDIPSLPTGVTLAPGTEWTVEVVDGTPADQIATPSWDGTGSWVFAAGMIPAGETYGFIITATLSINIDEVKETDDACEAGEVGIPLRNDLGMISGEYEADDESCVRVPSPATWTLQKSSDPASGSKVQPGSTVKYTLTVTNTSDEAILMDAVVLDDLSDVLKHATLDENALPEGVSVDGTELTWLVPDVNPGESASITYQVVVNKDAFNVKFKNVATPGSDGGECAPGDCTTNHVTPPKPGSPTLPKTGATVGGVLAMGLGLLGAGYLITRRKKNGVGPQHAA